MIPSVRYYLRFIDAEEKVKAFGFEKKVSCPLVPVVWKGLD